MAEYLEGTEDASKVELMKIFYGGRPCAELPLVTQLCFFDQYTSYLRLEVPHTPRRKLVNIAAFQRIGPVVCSIFTLSGRNIRCNIDHSRA